MRFVGHSTASTAGTTQYYKMPQEPFRADFWWVYRKFVIRLPELTPSIRSSLDTQPTVVHARYGYSTCCIVTY